MPPTAPEGPPPAGGKGEALRILVVNWLDRENPQAGGAEAHLHEIFGRIAAAGHEVVLLCSGFEGGPPRADLDGIEVHRTGGRLTFLLHARRYFRRHLRERGFDVVVEDLNKVPVFTPSWSDRPVVLLVHHLFGVTAFQEASFPVAAATWLLERPIPRVFRDRPVVAVSRSTEEDLVARGIPAANVTVIPNGVDVGRYTPHPRGERFETPTVLYLGRLKKYKRVDLPLRAVARLREGGSAVRMVVAGKGDDRERLVSLADDLGLGDAVEFRGFVSEEEKLDLFRRAWVHVLTSPKEGWGIANMEAAACGTPTVASDSPGLRESVLDGETGWLAPHGDVDALAGRIGRLLENREALERMGRRAREFAEAFSWDASARRMLALVRTVVGPRAPG